MQKLLIQTLPESRERNARFNTEAIAGKILFSLPERNGNAQKQIIIKFYRFFPRKISIGIVESESLLKKWLN